LVPDLNQPMTQTAFGELVGISQQAVSDLVSRGVLDIGAPAGVALRAYCAHLREQAAGRSTGGTLNLAAERAELAREQKIKIALQNAVTRRELAPVGLIEEVLAKAGSRVAGILDAIPGAVKRRLPTLPAEEVKAIAQEIARVRNIAANVSLADLREEADSAADEDTDIEAQS
jgi:terminase small subunit / prophage DNA-packing protein